LRMTPTGKFEIAGEFEFAAAHALRSYRGSAESLHGHNFRARVVLAVSGLDSDGIGFDFVEFQGILESVKSVFDHRNLNEIPPFDKINPTSENLAVEIARLIEAGLKDYAEETRPLPKVTLVEVYETPSVSARYYPQE